jgi:CBS-domain-containing membrane protein
MKVLNWLGIELVEVSRAEKLVSAIGSAVAIFCVFCIMSYSLPAAAAVGVIASMGATAVLLYAVPHGPLSQPWPLIGGHTISAVIGVCCARSISSPALATAIAVGLAIGVMYQLKCIHPPGGATAFTAVMGGQAVHELGFYFVLYPVLLNAVAMLLLAMAINYPFAWRRYPAFLILRADNDRPDNETVPDEMHENVLDAIRSLDSFVDVSEQDLLYLIRTIAKNVETNGNGKHTVQCRDASDRWLVPVKDETDSQPHM